VNPGARPLTVGGVSAQKRIALAAGILLLAWWVSEQIRSLDAYVSTNPARLGFEMMGIGVGLAILATGLAVALPGPVAERLGLGRSKLPSSAVIALVIGTLGLSLAVDTALSLTRAIEGSVATGIARGTQAARSSQFDFVIALLGSALAPALGEELLCRGVVQRTLARALGPLAAIAGASLFFGWLHGELVHGTIAALLGAYIGVLAYWSDSTRTAIAAHAANNVVALLGSTGLVWVPLSAVPAIALGLGIAVLALVWGWLARPRGEPIPVALQPGGDPADA
jgi:membrane protease YdiL (CAAX protease family)